MIKSACFKRTCGLFGNDYRVAALSLLYLTVIRISMQNLKSIDPEIIFVIKDKILGVKCKSPIMPNKIALSVD